MLKGIAASSGIVVSKVYKLEHPSFEIKKISADPSIEVKKFESALERTREDITRIKEAAVGRLSDEELAIFDAHLMVASDPELLGQVTSIINEEKVNAEFAVEQVASAFIAMMEAMDDDYFRERAADIKDVTYRIKCHILNVVIPDLSLIKEESIIVAHDLTPSDTAQLNKKYAKGFATEMGGRTSHSAIMARSLEIPAVVGCAGIMSACKHGDVIAMDAIAGTIIVNPTAQEIEDHNLRCNVFIKAKEGLKVMKDVPSITLDSHKVLLVGNIGTPADAQGVIENGGEGVGLYRTEFLYMGATELPSEEDQFVAYKTVLESMKDKPVVVRTLDIGGDKKLPYLPIPEEMNPFLGYRAIRLCLDRTDIFRTQIRALLRASVYGHLCIMFPMIATIGEFTKAKEIVMDEKANLLKEGQKVSDDFEIGMMVEIPAAAVLADQFAKIADFFSIGTNDLIQYSMAADRMSESVSYLYQPLNPSILRLIKMTIDGAHKEGKWCGMCGEMAGDELAVPLLIGLGLDEFSMSATSILAARKMVRNLKKSEMEILAAKAIQLNTAEEVEELVKKAIKN
ncbi:MAG: phosphoenolpyruvate--protein phosphotransferase [Erysipelotrichaceae bacterium]|nr:phosphoenolpyruvate--protein phosphotransferase [Erysipelotrichaceae bacterium]